MSQPYTDANPGAKRILYYLSVTLLWEPSGQTAGNRRWREKLPVLAALFPRLFHAGLPAARIGQGENMGCGWGHHEFM